MLGHLDRLGGSNASWNSVHPSQGCSQQNLIATGGLDSCIVSRRSNPRNTRGATQALVSIKLGGACRVSGQRHGADVSVWWIRPCAQPDRGPALALLLAMAPIRPKQKTDPRPDEALRRGSRAEERGETTTAVVFVAPLCVGTSVRF
jgi:hypothetical protein